MAYRRSIIARTKSFYQQQQRLAPSISHFSTSDRDRDDVHATRISEIRFHSYISNRFLKTRNNYCNSQLSRNVVYGLVSRRNFSSGSGGERVCFGIEALKNTEVLNDVSEVLSDVVGVVGNKAVVVAPVMNEVAVATAGSFSPVAALQFLVDHVHCYTGYNWWASIAVTTLLLRFIHLPVLIQKWKIRAKRLDTVGPRDLEKQDDLEKQKAHTVESGTNKFDDDMDKGALFFSDVTMISFFFAISNMAEKVPSFATGGTLWFTDLTTPDRVWLPFLFGLTLLIRWELEFTTFGAEGAPSEDETWSDFAGAAIGAAASVASFSTLTLTFPKAIFCYWITSNLFSIVMMDPLLLKWFGISTNNKTRISKKKKRKVL